MVLELTPAQQDIYLEGRLFGKVVNNIGGYQVYRGELDLGRFRHARTRLLQENDAYRLRFREIEGRCTPFLSDQRQTELRIVDIATATAALAWIEERMATAFTDIASDVFEDALLRLASDEHWYFSKAHHLIMDGWGFALQMRRFLGMYAASGEAGPEGVPAHPPRSFVDHMLRQSGYRGSPQYLRSREHWLSRHTGARDALFPLSHAPAAIGSRRVSAVLDAALLTSLRELAANAKADLVAVMHAALYLYFSRSHQRTDLIIGSPVHNRRNADDKDTIGSIVNVNMHRFAAQPGISFIQLVEYVASVLRQDYRHGRFPLGDLVRALREDHGTSDELPYEIAFNYQKLDFDFQIHGEPVETHYMSHSWERVPLTFVLCDYGNQHVRLHLDYALGHFDEAAAQTMLDRLVYVLHQVAADGRQRVASYRLLLAEEWQNQFSAWQGANVALRAGACIHDFFEEQTKRTPEAIAVVCSRSTLTYTELNSRANQLAARLIEQDAGPGHMVGVCHGRSLELVIALLAVLKSGAAYVPIDPAYPPSRIRHILDDARPAILLADAMGAQALGDLGRTAIRTDLPCAKAGRDDRTAVNPSRATTRLSAREVAYVIYTSGSTGRPKGVLIEHRNAAAFIQWALAHYSASELSAVLAATSICFDLSVFELFVPLASGGRVVLAENVLALRDQQFDGLSLINTVPSAIRVLLDAEAIPASVRCLNLAGELLQQELVDALYAQLADVKVYDLYGPSESTTYSTVCLRSKGGDASIGRPIHNTQVYVLDEAGDPLPTGMVGELHIAGAGLSRGYLNQPAPTAERFVFNPHADTRVYRTGDLARWTSDGRLQYRGRKDNQEKIRGYRVEPGEVEACLLEHPAVSECVVVGHGTAGAAEGRILLAYVVVASAGEDNAAPTTSEVLDDLARFLAMRLPAHMLPSRFIPLSTLPLTPNGKVDRNALPAPGSAPHRAATDAAPGNDTEQRLGMLWQDTLQQEGIGIDENFLSRGGDSLLLLKLASSIEREFALRIDLPLLFSNPTIAAQSRLLIQQLELERVRHAACDLQEAASDTFIDL
ncbi:amino acid adenylation domain-containing protein [Xanthomonas sp. LMG 8992]|uniref:non-ribosomal peptide synthetase n=1 Tax=Xanthomonas sp. LMG 8992 TaxID=1591157 RepID=UPI00136F01A3|nr:amino acid adenylation domain-containing protein [Xanthomonas sp. LMG 8992]MXV10593.1 amino acid adenylation domain-containing protein [Xanthomonas sp. LMG 8992]